MNSLPLEIENKIWNIYYKDIYSEKIIGELNVINDNFHFVRISVSKLKRNILSEKYIYVEKNNIIDLNNKINILLHDNVFKLIYKNNPYFNYLFEILKFNKIYSGIPEKCKLAAVFLNKSANFNPKLLKRLKIICANEHIILSNCHYNTIRSIKN